jgi:hypothetical protein
MLAAICLTIGVFLTAVTTMMPVASPRYPAVAELGVIFLVLGFVLWVVQ